MGVILRTGLVPGLLTLEKASMSLATSTPPPFALDNGETISTCKLFLNSMSSTDVTELLSFIPVRSRLVIALGLEFMDESPLSTEELSVMSAIFQSLPSTVQKGVADCSLPRLKQILDIVEVDFCQVNAAVCFSLPSNLLRFAQDHHIEVKAHLDPPHVSVPGHSTWISMLRKTLVYPQQQVIAATEFIVVL